MIASLCQAVIQAAPTTIYVREAPGMPEWVKILISAGTGALFAIIGSVVMEFMKPKIAKRALKREITAQLVGEVEDNLRPLREVREILKEDEILATKNYFRIVTILKRVADERYREYLETHKILIYEIDHAKNLDNFYDLSKKQLPSSMERYGRQFASSRDEMGSPASLVEHAIHVGTWFVTFQTEPMYKKAARWLKGYLNVWRR
jgi:hypothetical protein